MNTITVADYLKLAASGNEPVIEIENDHGTFRNVSVYEDTFGPYIYCPTANGGYGRSFMTHYQRALIVIEEGA